MPFAARQHREQHEHRDDGDDHDLHAVSGVPEPAAQSRADLQDAEAERGGDAEDRADEGERVDDVAPGAAHPLAEERFERPADRDRTAPAVDRVGERDADDDVDRPRLHAPVQVGLDERALRELRLGAGDARPRRDEVAEGSLTP
jgi:hypothetical protein